MYNFRKLLFFRLAALIFFIGTDSSITHALSAEKDRCIKPQSVSLRDLANSDDILVVKHFRAISGDNACFGNMLKLKVLSFTSQAANISVKQRGKKRKVFSVDSGAIVRLQRFNIKLVSLNNDNASLFRIAYKASPTTVFPQQDANIASCFLTYGPACYLQDGKLSTGYGLCSNEVPLDTKMLYEGEC